MAVDEWRRDQEPAGVDLLPRCGRVDLRPELDDAPALHGDVDAGPPIRKRRIANEEVEHGSASPAYLSRNADRRRSAPRRRHEGPGSHLPPFGARVVLAGADDPKEEWQAMTAVDRLNELLEAERPTQT